VTPHGLVRVRHTVQWTLLTLFVVLPFTGLFRIDAGAGRFLIGGFQIWWDDFFIVFPFWAMVFFTATAFYSSFGMIFCGWACPQHTLSELLNGLARKLDFSRLKDETRQVLAQVDHSHLNEVFPFTELNPTAENIAKWVWEMLGKRLEATGHEVTRVTVWESDSAAATFVP